MAEMLAACPTPGPMVGPMRALLAGVDCNVRGFAEAGYLALGGPHSVFPAALTALLTIYVALLGYRLLFGMSGLRLADTPLIALKIGTILALTLNWAVFQTLVFDLAYRAPLQIASTLTAPVPGANGRDPLGGAERAYGELLADAAAFGQQATQKTDGGGAAEANAAEELVKTARTLFMATVGILAIAIIAIGVLTAAGPVFIALFLFDATRGLFVGWVRALLTVALIPLCAWATITLMLITLRPGLSRLAAERAAHTLSVDSATAVTAVVTVFAFAQAVLALAALVIATGFRPGRLRPARGSRERAAPASSERGFAPIQQSRVDRLVDALQSSAYLERSRHAASYAAAPAALNRDGPAGTAPDTIRVGGDYRRVRFTDRQTALRREPQA